MITPELAASKEYHTWLKRQADMDPQKHAEYRAANQEQHGAKYSDFISSPESKEELKRASFLMKAHTNLPTELRLQIASDFEDTYSDRRINDAAIAHLERERTEGGMIRTFPVGQFDYGDGNVRMIPRNAASHLNQAELEKLGERFSAIRENFDTLPPEEFNAKFPRPQS